MPDDSFVPDSFEPDEEDSFVEDSFEPDEAPINDWRTGGILDPNKTWSQKLGVLLSGPDQLQGAIGTPENEPSLLPSFKQPETYWGGFFNSLYEDLVKPLATPSGAIGSATIAPSRLAQLLEGSTPLKIYEPPPPSNPEIRGLLPAPPSETVGRLTVENRPAPGQVRDFIAGIEGRVQNKELITPQEEARLAGFDVGPEGPVPLSSMPGRSQAKAVDLGELREIERQKALGYTSFEHEGGVPLVLPDRPMMDIPPESGDVRLGFSAQSQGDLPYPLNVVPNAVRPRSVQAVTRALAGDEFAAPVAKAEKVEFVSGKPEPPAVTKTTRDLQGGTAAIEYDPMTGKPKEPMLPSAVKIARNKVKENTGLDIPDKVTLPADTPKPVADAVKAGVANFVKESEQPSAARKSIYTQLSQLGPAGKQIVHRVQRAMQTRAQYDAVWTEPLFSHGARLSREEFKNFGAYVEQRMPIPNARVQAAVDKWNQMQNMMGDMAVSKGLHLKRGKEIIPFQKIENNYWPHIPAEQLTKESIVDRLVSNGLSRHEATIVARKWEKTGEILLSPQHSRLNSVFKYRDDFDVSIAHGRSMSKRIANHEHLGPKDIAGKGDEGIADLIEATTDKDLAYKLAERLAGRGQLPNEKLMRGLNQARKWMSLTSLPNFSIPNVILGQGMNAHMALMSRHPIEAAKEIGKLFSRSYRDTIRSSGVFNTFNRTLTEELHGIDPFQIGVGEKINRSVAAAIGRSTVRTAFEDYKSGVNVPTARQWLENLLSRNPDEITEITPELERFAAGRMAEISQGLNNPGNLPYTWSNPVNNYENLAIQLMLIFKKVGFQTTKTVKDTVMMQPTIAGKATALATWAALSQVAGELVGDVKSAITGRERPDDINRIAENWGNAFMLGLPWELITSAQYGPSSLMSTIAGPVASKTSDLAAATWQTGEKFMNDSDDWTKPIRRFGIRNLPIPGRERIYDWDKEN